MVGAPFETHPLLPVPQPDVHAVLAACDRGVHAEVIEHVLRVLRHLLSGRQSAGQAEQYGAGRLSTHDGYRPRVGGIASTWIGAGCGSSTSPWAAGRRCSSHPRAPHTPWTGTRAAPPVVDDDLGTGILVQSTSSRYH